MPGINLADYIKVGYVDIPDLGDKPQLAKRNNNPGNLRFVGQVGAEPGEGGFARFKTPEDGYQALVNQVKLDQSRKLPLAQFISKYAPPSENDTATYLTQASQQLGITPDVTIDQLDADQIAKFMAFKESQTKVDLPEPQDIIDLNDFINQEQAQPSGPSVGSTLSNLRKLFRIFVNEATPDETAEFVNARAGRPDFFTSLKRAGVDAVKAGVYAADLLMNPTRRALAATINPEENAITLPSPKDVITGMPLAFASLLTDPLETALGISIKEDQLRPLTTDELTRTIKGSAANIIGLAAPIKVGRAFAKDRMLSQALKHQGAVSTEALEQIVKPTLGKAAVKGTIEGAVGGLAYSAIAEAGSPDYGKQLLVNGIMFAPLGTAFELTGFGLSQLRGAQAKAKSTLQNLALLQEALQESDNISQALIKDAAGEPTLITEAKPEEIAGQKFVMHEDQALVDGTPEQNEQFIKTGFVDDQVVSVDGVDQFVVSSTPENVTIENPVTGEQQTVSPKKVRRNSGRMVLYHGTDRRFPAFRLTHIRSGTGGLAQGWGLYFGEHPIVADEYRKSVALSGLAEQAQIVNTEFILQHHKRPTAKNIIDGMEVDSSNAKILRAMLKAGAFEDGESVYKVLRNLASSRDFRAADLPKVIEDLGAELGQFYAVELRADPNHFLDWDLRIDKQHPYVQRALAKLGYDKFSMRKWTGEDLYQKMVREIDLPPNIKPINASDEITFRKEFVSKKLLSVGIKGNKYLDQLSRAEGKGTFNYVVFSEKLVKILPKEERKSKLIDLRKPISEQSEFVQEKLTELLSASNKLEVLNSSEPVINALVEVYGSPSYAITQLQEAKLFSLHEQSFVNLWGQKLDEMFATFREFQAGRYYFTHMEQGISGPIVGDYLRLYPEPPRFDKPGFNGKEVTIYGYRVNLSKYLKVDEPTPPHILSYIRRVTNLQDPTGAFERLFPENEPARFKDVLDYLNTKDLEEQVVNYIFSVFDVEGIDYGYSIRPWHLDRPVVQGAIKEILESTENVDFNTFVKQYAKSKFLDEDVGNFLALDFAKRLAAETRKREPDVPITPGEEYLFQEKREFSPELKNAAAVGEIIERYGADWLHAVSDFESLTKAFSDDQLRAETQWLADLIDENDSPTVRDIYAKAASAARKRNIIPAEPKAMQRVEPQLPKTLEEQAATNNIIVEHDNTNGIVLRDADSDKIIGKADTDEQATELINKSGQADGAEALPDIPVPPGIVPPVPPTRLPHFGEGAPYFGDKNFGEGALDFINERASWLAQPRAMFIAVDKHFRTDFHNKFYNVGKLARSRFEAAITPYMMRLQEILKPVKGVNRKLIAGYMQTESAATIEATLTPDEIKLGRELAADNIDIQSVLKFARTWDDIISSTPAGSPEQIAMIDALKQEVTFDPKHLQAAARILVARKIPDMKLAGVARLVEAIENKSVDKPAFAAKHNFSPEMIKAAEELINFNRSFGVTSENELALIRSYARRVYDGHLTRALDDFRLTDAQKKVFTDLGETGQLNVYETDPFMAAQRHVRAAASIEHMRPRIKEMEAYFNKVIKTMPEDYRPAMRSRAQNFIHEIQGQPHKDRLAAQAVIRKLNERRGWNLNEDLIHEWVTIMMQTTDSALQGARFFYAGLRDIVTPTLMYDARFGKAATARMLSSGTKSRREALLAAGELETYNITTVAQDAAYQESVLGKLGVGVTNMNKALFKLSGQGLAYSRIATGIYIDRFKTAADVLNKVSRGEMTEAKAFKALKLQTYEPTTIREFTRLTREEGVEKAARYLARETVAENVGIFSAGNRMAWNRYEAGRLAGQYGTWVMYYRAFLGQMLTRGTVADRVAFMARIGASMGALAYVGSQLDVDFRNWYLPTGWEFAGGPWVGVGWTIRTAIFGRGVEADLARYKVGQWLPTEVEWNELGNINVPEPTGLKIPRINYPGFMASKDVLEALETLADGDTGEALLRLMNVKRQRH